MRPFPFRLVGLAGLEPARSNEQKILSLLCLPIPPQPREALLIVSVAVAAVQGFSAPYLTP
jgi:hypothetical protein